MRLWKTTQDPSKAVINQFREELQALKDITTSWSTDPVVVADELINKLGLSCCEVVDHLDSGVFIYSNAS